MARNQKNVMLHSEHKNVMLEAVAKHQNLHVTKKTQRRGSRSMETKEEEEMNLMLEAVAKNQNLHLTTMTPMRVVGIALVTGGLGMAFGPVGLAAGAVVGGVVTWMNEVPVIQAIKKLAAEIKEKLYTGVNALLNDWVWPTPEALLNRVLSSVKLVNEIIDLLQKIFKTIDMKTTGLHLESRSMETKEEEEMNLMLEAVAKNQNLHLTTMTPMRVVGIALVTGGLGMAFGPVGLAAGAVVGGVVTWMNEVPVIQAIKKLAAEIKEKLYTGVNALLNGWVWPTPEALLNRVLSSVKLVNEIIDLLQKIFKTIDMALAPKLL
ncbi:hypothetical protein Q7C36_012060 [Tachysurus vachellii]|uniref:Uncharacterized protein n=1 Tax=Tachysurus vachellii TaxID=175792 RepID=A0AA88MRW4_TACVA|nr:hypothetical protein Q7C36_012060 [Tachysurus vachellii]